MPAEERAHGTISTKTYFQYFIAGGGYVFTIIVLTFLVLTEVSEYTLMYSPSNLCIGKHCCR